MPAATSRSAAPAASAAGAPPAPRPVPARPSRARRAPARDPLPAGAGAPGAARSTAGCCTRRAPRSRPRPTPPARCPRRRRLRAARAPGTAARRWRRGRRQRTPGPAPPQPLCDQVADGGQRTARQAAAPGPRGRRAARRAAARRPRRPRAGGYDHGDRQLLEPRHEEREEPQRRCVRPVRVVDREDQRRAVGQRRAQPVEAVQDPERGVQRLARGAGLVALRPRQPEPPAGRSGRPLIHIAPRGGRRRERRLEQLAGDPKREVTLELRTARREHGQSAPRGPPPAPPRAARTCRSRPGPRSRSASRGRPPPGSNAASTRSNSASRSSTRTGAVTVRRSAGSRDAAGRCGVWAGRRGDRRSARPRLAVCARARPDPCGRPASRCTASRPRWVRPAAPLCLAGPGRPETQGGHPAVACTSAGQTGRQTGSSPPLGGLAEPVVYLPRRNCPR